MNDKTRKMHILSITPNDTLSIMASFEKKKYELPTEYTKLTPEEYEEIKAKVSGDFLPLKNVLHMWQEKLREVSFRGTLAQLDLIAITDNGLFCWNDVKVYKYDFASGKSVHVVYPKSPIGDKFNRRRGVRISVDRIMEVEQDGHTFLTFVRDLSYCGVSLSEMTDERLDPEKKFVLHFTEETGDGEKYIGDFEGKIVNQKEKENGQIVSGCVLASYHASFLQKYIATKQIESLRGHQPTDGITKNMTGENWELDLAEALTNIGE